MSSVPVMINGVLWDKYGRVGRPVVLYGEATIAGLGVGGGPIIPPEQPPTGEPPIIWGPPGPWPGWPADPGIPGNTPGNRPGAVVPPMPPPPSNPNEPKPPTDNQGWGWYPGYGWGYFPPQVMPQATAPKK